MGMVARFDLATMINRFRLLHFVETGTGVGSSLNFASAFGFNTLCSCEIEQKLAEHCKAMFAGRPSIRVYNLDSMTFLDRLLDVLNKDEPVLFWLDAHFPGVDYQIRKLEETTESGVRLPLENELVAIMAARSMSRDVILIDDLRIYKDGPFANGNLPEHLRPVCPSDRNIDFVHRHCGATHDVQELYDDEGYIMLTPKES
jgi:hypothetical protein